MIIRGATGRKMPYGRIYVGDILYFINNNTEGIVKSRGVVNSVYDSDKMSTEESKSLVKQHQDKLQLSDNQFKKWAGKRYIVSILELIGLLFLTRPGYLHLSYVLF